MASTLQPYPAASKTEKEAFYFICGQTPHVVGASLSPSHSGDFPVPSAVVSSNKHRAPSSPSLQTRSSSLSYKVLHPAQFPLKMAEAVTVWAKPIHYT